MNIEIQSFLSFDGYYMSFIQGFFSLTALLTCLIRKEEHFVWTIACKQSFQTLKKRLTTTPILSLPDNNDDFVVYSRTSGIRLSCVLMKRDRVIAYTSRLLKVYEQNYPIHDLKLVIVVFALHIWRHYLLGVSFQLFTNHKRLKYIFI